MRPPAIVPLADEHLAAAVELLEARHARHRASEPLLPERVDFAAEVAALREQEDASGWIALRGRRAVGFLLAAPRENPVWGPNVWVELAGHAVEEAEDVRDLYAAAAGQWFEAGRNATTPSFRRATRR